jgi:hypothetical protein
MDISLCLQPELHQGTERTAAPEAFRNRARNYCTTDISSVLRRVHCMHIGMIHWTLFQKKKKTESRQ